MWRKKHKAHKPERTPIQGLPAPDSIHWTLMHKTRSYTENISLQAQLERRHPAQPIWVERYHGEWHIYLGRVK